MIFYHPCELYLLTTLSGIYQYTPPVNDILSFLWVVFTHSFEWYLPVYTPVNDILSSLWVVFTHSFEWYLPIYTPCKWYFPPTVNGIYSSLSGIYTLLWVIFPLTVSGIYSHLWVLFTHTFEWYLFTHLSEWYFHPANDIYSSLFQSGVYSFLWVLNYKWYSYESISGIYRIHLWELYLFTPVSGIYSLVSCIFFNRVSGGIY